MERAISAVVTAAALVCGPAAAADGPIGVVVNPDWLRRPTGADMAHAYPKIAQEFEIEGQATISCRVTDVGMLEACEVVAESVPEIGFGAAALSLAPSFQMRPKMVGGRAVPGGTARIPIRFVLPGRRSAEALPQVGSAKALELGRRLAILSHDAEYTIEHYDRAATALERVPDEGARKDVRSEAAGALRAASKARFNEVREAYASIYATVFSEAELEAIISFLSSASGPLSILAHDEELELLDAAMEGEFVRRASAEARAEFCRARDCAGSALELAKQSEREASKSLRAPIWAATPAKWVVARTTPPIVRLLGLGGVVRLECIATPEGLLEECRTQFEHPGGLGLRTAAVDLAKHYRLSPAQVSQGASGEEISVWIEFPAEPGDPPYNGPQANSPRRLELARQYVRTEPTVFDMRERRSRFVERLAERPPRGADGATHAAAVEALREGVSRAHDAFIEQRANAYAARFAEEQLMHAITFAESPAGKALAAKEATLIRLFDATARRLGQSITTDAWAAFCRARKCPTASSRQPASANPAASTRTP